ncbi:ABC transporter ATP-binding protein [Actinokineospora sp. 24-640]
MLLEATLVRIGLRDITKVFPGGAVALDGVELDIADGEFMVLIGPSGCGKSTLLRIIAGLESPTEGEVFLDGMAAGHLTPKERQVAMVFQNFALYPHMRAGENIAFPLRISGMDVSAQGERVAESAAALGVRELLSRWPHQLSGGQRQRVAMGRALVRQPRLFLLDEPLSNLDSGLRAELRAEISAMVRSLGVTTVYVTHDQTEALTLADHIAVLRGGVLQDVGAPGRVYDKPATMFVAAFLGTPRITLLEAFVYVYLNSHVALRVGDQQLSIPWADPRARELAHYHGESIVVGVRAEALAPIAEPRRGQSLSGTIGHLEHHGHESLAFVDIGATEIDLDAEIAKPSAAVATRRHARKTETVFSRLLDRVTRQERPQEDAAQDTGHAGRHHLRPAELTVRLPPRVRASPGENMTIGVRLGLLHFFERRGARIDVGWR